MHYLLFTVCMHDVRVRLFCWKSHLFSVHTISKNFGPGIETKRIRFLSIYLKVALRLGSFFSVIYDWILHIFNG
jgi:hypothetical protein